MNLTISPIAMTYAKMANSSTNQIQNPNNINFTAKQTNKISSTDARIKELRAENQRLVEENKELKTQNALLLKEYDKAWNFIEKFTKGTTEIRKNHVYTISEFMSDYKVDVNTRIVDLLLSTKDINNENLFPLKMQVSYNRDFNLANNHLEEVSISAAVMAKSNINKAGIFPCEDENEFIHKTIERALISSPEVRIALKDKDKTRLMMNNTISIFEKLKVEPKSYSLDTDIITIFTNVKDFYKSLDKGIASIKEKNPNCIVKERIVDGDLEASSIGVKLQDAKRTRYYKVEDIARSAQNERIFNEET